MNATPETEGASDAPQEPSKKPGKRKLILIAAPLGLLLLGGGLWFSGILPHLLGMEKHPDGKEETQAETPTYVDVPELVANLNTSPKKPGYVKMTIRIEVPNSADADKVKTAMPRIQDVVQTYLREMRPEELRGSAGVYRLREELLVRANAAVAPARISDILFTQMLIQ